MRRFFRAVTVLAGVAGVAGPLAAQAPVGDTLPPRAYERLAMQAKAYDSVEVRAGQWRTWAAAAPTAVAPRLALATLMRLDTRMTEADAWLDSARRVATTAAWRNAIIRERIEGLVMRGEFVALQALIAPLLADSAGMPREEWAMARYELIKANGRRGGKLTLAAVDSVAALASPTDSVLHARLECLRAGTDVSSRIVEHGEAAMALAEAARVPSISANCALAIGTFISGTGQTALSLQWLGRAETLARAARDLPTLAATLQWRGYILSTIGFIQSARSKLTEAIRVAQQFDGRNTEAYALLAVANTAQQIGDAASTSLALRRAASLFEATGDTYGAENNRLEQAAAMIMLGDLAGTEASALRGLAYANRIQNGSMELRSSYMLANVAMHRGQFDVAAAWLDTAEVRVRRLGTPWQTQLTLYRGILAMRTGKTEDALRDFTEVRDRTIVGQNLMLHNANGALARAWLMKGDTAKAAQMLVTASDALDAVRSSIGDGGFRKVITLPPAWGRSGGSIDEVLAAMAQSRRWLPTAFSVTERARSRSLLKGAFGSESGDTALLNQAERRVSATATNLQEVQRSLAPQTALLVYAGGSFGAPTALMVITRTSARGLPLATLDSLDRDIVRWLSLMEAGESGAGAGRRVAAAVLSTALRSLPPTVKRLVIVPQGPLYRVPFQALPLGRGVLGDRAVVTIAPSVSLALAYAGEARSVPARVLALGAGDTEVASFTPQLLELNIERSERGNPLAPLLAAADEARAAASWGRGSIALTGVDASEAALKREALKGYTVLHAAAHALTSDQTLGANWLILRPDSSDDGYVSGGELAALSMGHAMVVLSGCRTTGDFGSRGDAIDGLVAPLLARGVRTVVASHWAVSDRWTKVLMERFYQQLARGATTAEAMNLAQTSLRREGVPARFWAAFSVIGDGALTFAPAPITPWGGR